MKIGIIGAMRTEIEPLLERFKEYEEEVLGNQTYYKIKVKDHTLIIVQSNIGKVAASMTATLLITKFTCEEIIFTGVAGGLKDSLEIGDLLVATSLVHHDVDISVFGHKKGYIPSIGREIKTNQKLRESLKEVAKKHSITLHEGIIATGDQFISSKEKKEEIIKEFNASAIEMEGVAVAQVCQELSIPSAIIRSISDKANGDAPENFDKFVEIAAKNSSKLTLAYLDSIFA